jgi:hypothetical protein
MKEQLKQVWRDVNYIKNILFVILAFSLGIALNLSQYAIILLIIGVGATSTWWFSRPHFKNASSQLILETLRKYPAVIIKNNPHLVAFGGRDPVLAAAYRSPVPRFMLKKQISQTEITKMDCSLADLKMNTFIIFKIKLNSYTPIHKALRHFEKFIEVLEMNFQASFSPAERYEVVHLFGLEGHLKGSRTDSEAKTDKTDSPSASSHELTPSTPKTVKLSFNRPKPPTTIPTIPKPTKSFNELILGLGLVAGRDQQAVFNDKLSMKQCATIHYGLKSKLTTIYNLDFENERLPPKILDEGAKYSFVVFGVNKFPNLVWVYLSQNTVQRLIREFDRIKILFSALDYDDFDVCQDRLREIMNILTNRFQVTSSKVSIPKINVSSKLTVNT